MILALCALGRDPETEDAFIRNGMTLTDGLELYARDGCYSHTPDGKADVTATTQTVLAFIAMERFRGGEGFLYCFTGK